MILTMSGWLVAIVFAAAAVVFALAQRKAAADARRAARRFELLRSLTPSLSASPADSARETCGRIVDRLLALVTARVALCFVVESERLVLGAKRGGGYAEFLRVGAACDGESIVDWARARGRAAIVGPRPAELPPDVDVQDLRRDEDGRDFGPAAGSRDRVWALALPLSIDRGHALPPEIVGVAYLERAIGERFSADDVRTASLVAALAADAVSRAALADTVRRDAAVDGLTHLLTPTAFRRRLRDEVGPGRDLALFFIDTDHFKRFNDTFGHAAGDRLLRTLAATFARISGAGGGFAGRNGGDEFCIALPDRTKDAAVELAELTRAQIAAIDLSGVVGAATGDFSITASIGVAHFPVDVDATDRSTADRLLEIADEQMYEAKRAGRDRVSYSRASARAALPEIPGDGPVPRV